MINEIMVRFLKYILLVFVLFSCESKKEETLFKLLDPDISGIKFQNNLKFDNDFNVYKYRNYYNGGGVSIGDIDNDGLQDVYMTSNLNSNKL